MMTSKHLSGTAVVCLMTAMAMMAGCNRAADVESVPIGSSVQLTRQDGGVVTGTLSSRDADNVRVTVGRASRLIARNQIADVAVVTASEPVRLPALAKFREYTVPEGTVLSARLETPVGSSSNRLNDPVEAVLTRAVVVDGVDVLPEGSTLHGVVTTAQPSGDVKGRASVAVQFRSIAAQGSDETYPISSGFQHTAAGTQGSDVKKIALPAVGGAILGGIIGGKKGAVIGATVGGGAGAAVVLTTSGPEVRYARGTVVSLPLGASIDVRVPIRK
jgi:hypothetical protein